MKVKTSELIGTALDWAVAQSMNWGGIPRVPPFSTIWAQGGPIIEREEIAVGKGWEQWAAFKDADTEDGVLGPTPLIAAMRCFVASKMGDSVEIPDQFIKG